MDYGRKIQTQYLSIKLQMELFLICEKMRGIQESLWNRGGSKVTLDIYKGEQILIEDQYWFEDLEQILGEEEVINES